MVDPRVIAAVRAVLGDRPRRVLVTGGTGFVGSRVAWLLAEAGQQVTVLGRNRYRLGRAWHPHVQFAAADVTDAAAVARVGAEQDVVIHAAAHTALWGPAETFQHANVDGTRHVLALGQRQPALRIVHVSSTAIHFAFRDRLDVADDAPLPDRFACAYAASKANAEAAVNGAVSQGVNAVIVRARAVFGPGDNSLLPRLLHAARGGRFPRIGAGDNRVDLTYVDNLAYAICLAIVRGEPGSVCTITNDAPVALWPTLDQLFQSLGLPPTRGRLPYPLASAFAIVASGWHRLLRRDGEPRLTRYSVGLLAKSQTFSPAAARRVLQYEPIVSVEQGLRQTLDHLTARDAGHATTHVELTLFTTGYTSQPYYLAERGRGRERQSFHATCALLRHPRHGLFLFDTGYAPRFLDATRRWPFRVYAWLTPVVLAESLTVRAQLAERGVAAADIRGVIVSHFHADHVAGLRDFPRAEFITAERTWRAVARRRGFAALRRAFVPALLPDDFVTRLRTIEHFHDPGIGPFARSHDLFGDGSVRLIELSGHATGQLGALVQTGPQQRTLLAADATWTLGSLRQRTLPHPLTFGFIDSVRELRESLTRLADFGQEFPEVEIVPTHCPEVAARWGFDAVVRQHVPGD